MLAPAKPVFCWILKLRKPLNTAQAIRQTLNKAPTCRQQQVVDLGSRHDSPQCICPSGRGAMGGSMATRLTSSRTPLEAVLMHRLRTWLRTVDTATFI